MILKGGSCIYVMYQCLKLERCDMYVFIMQMILSFSEELKIAS